MCGGSLPRPAQLCMATDEDEGEPALGNGHRYDHHRKGHRLQTERPEKSHIHQQREATKSMATREVPRKPQAQPWGEATETTDTGERPRKPQAQPWGEGSDYRNHRGDATETRDIVRGHRNHRYRHHRREVSPGISSPDGACRGHPLPRRSPGTYFHTRSQVHSLP